MTRVAPSIGVVVLAARGGAPLERALDDARWADTRAVLAAEATGPALPAGVRRLGDPDDVARLDADWILVLREDEHVDEAGIRSAVATAGDEVLALPLVAGALAMRLRARRPAIRLAPAGSRIGVGRGLAVEMARGARPVRRIDAVIERAGGETLTDAVERLGADASLVALLLDRDARRMRGILWQPLVAAMGALAARASDGPLGIGRWVLAVLEGYGAVFAYARLWERRHDRAVSFT